MCIFLWSTKKDLTISYQNKTKFSKHWSEPRYFYLPFCTMFPVPTTSIIKVCYISNWITVIVAEFSTWQYISVVVYILCWSKPLEILYFMPTQVIDCNRITEELVSQTKRNCQQILEGRFSTKVHFCDPSSFSSVFISLILLTEFPATITSFSFSPSCRCNLFSDRSIQTIPLCNLKKTFCVLACTSEVLDCWNNIKLFTGDYNLTWMIEGQKWILQT